MSENLAHQLVRLALLSITAFSVAVILLVLKRIGIPGFNSKSPPSIYTDSDVRKNVFLVWSIFLGGGIALILAVYFLLPFGILIRHSTVFGVLAALISVVEIAVGIRMMKMTTAGKVASIFIGSLGPILMGVAYMQEHSIPIGAVFVAAALIVCFIPIAYCTRLSVKRALDRAK